MKKVTLLGFICLAVILTVMSFAACAEQAAPPPVTVTGPGGTVTVSAPAVTVTAPAKTVTAPAVTVTSTPAAKEPTYTVLNPKAQQPERQVTPLNPRLDTLVGKKIAVINLHGGNEEAIISVVADLKAAVPGCNVIYFRTDGGFGGNPLTTDDWAKMTDCDAAIIGHGF